MNDNTLADLERLARLKAEGALTDAEYEDAKRRVFNGDPSAPYTASPSTAQSPGKLSKTWAFRFDFMSQHGLPHSPTFVAASKTLTGWRRQSLMFSSLAFFFGPIYFLILGLWRPAVTLIGVSIVYGFIVGRLGLSDAVERAALLAYGVVYALTCVPLYYLKVTKGIHSWNPFFWAGPAWR